MKNKGKKIWSFVIAAVIVIAGAVYGIDLTMDKATDDSGIGTASQSLQTEQESGQSGGSVSAKEPDRNQQAKPAKDDQNQQEKPSQASQGSEKQAQNAKNIQAARAGTLNFRSESLLEEHFEKHGIEMGFSSEQEYLKAARLVVADSESLHKLEAEDGDDVYYLEASNEFVIVSTDGYLRTYFYPNDGIDYFNRQ